MILTSFREELAWLAGILDGEASFGFERFGNPKIALAMTDRDVVERAHRLMRATGSIRIKKTVPGRKTQFTFALSTRASVGWMMMLYPWLGQRRQARIRDVLAAWRRRRVYNKYRQACRYGHPLMPRVGQSRYCPECERRRGWIGGRSSYHASPAQLTLVS